jgi:hypothetical protein
MVVVRKRFICLASTFLFSVFMYAQNSEGGLPLSMDPAYSSEMSGQQYIPLVSLPAPDINKLRIEDSLNYLSGDDLLRIGALVNADIDIQKNGAISLLHDGKKLWRMKIQVPDMQALGLYYDQFQLPQGVKYFLYNSNEKQVLGAYSINENPDDGIWANEKVQGDIVNLEMDFDAGVDISTVKMHIDNVGVFYRATAYLQRYETLSSGLRTTSTLFHRYDSSSSCEIDALCSPGTSYPNLMKATVHVEYISGGFIYAGSGTMINNTNQDCAPLFLTATHIEPSNSTSNTTFANWIFYFNYQKPSCGYTGAEPSPLQTVTGAYFDARASYNSSLTSIDGDFLLLLLKKNPTSYGFYLAGWDRTDATLPVPGTFVSFHHPWADVKKVSEVTTHISPFGNFNGGGTNTHWSLTWSAGGTEEGSSGSGLFNSSEHLIGILSGGRTNSPSCTARNSGGYEISDYALYSKLSHDWLYGGASTAQLKPWLDPANTGVTSLNGMTSCTTIVLQVNQNKQDLVIYPNPANGIININAGNISAGQIRLYDVLGKALTDLNITGQNRQFKADLSDQPAGIYIVQITNGVSVFTQKITLVK